jgi:hypothetical protein
MHIKFWWESQKKGHHYGDPDICRWDVNMKMDLREIGWGDMHWIDLV